MEIASRPERGVQRKFFDGIECGCVAQVAFRADIAWGVGRRIFHHRRHDGDARDADEN